jgi:hypothetical protein
MKKKVHSAGKLALEMRDLQSRNKRQEEFIFTMQKKLDLAQEENKNLMERINEIISGQRKCTVDQTI